MITGICARVAVFDAATVAIVMGDTDQTFVAIFGIFHFVDAVWQRSECVV
jgi:hypothetical protein